MPDAVEAYNNSEGVLSIYGVLLVQAAAAQNIMVVQRRKIHGVDFCGECNEFPCKMLIYGREAKDKTWIASPATIPKSGERNRKIHSCMLYFYEILL